MIIKKQPLISCSRIDKGKSNLSHTKHKTYEIETKSNTLRAQGGKGLLSRSISVQQSQKSILQNLTLEKKGRKKRGREGDARERQCLVCAPAREKRERVGEGIFMPTNSRTKRLNYP